MSLFKILIFIFIVYFIYSAFRLVFAVKRGVDEFRNNKGQPDLGFRGGRGSKDSSNTIELDHDQYKVE
jgi:hypothetical protein